MKKLFYALLLAGIASTLHPVFAQDAAKKKSTAKQTVKKITTKTVAATTTTVAANTAIAANSSDDDEDLGEANIDGSTVTHFNCELGNKITTYTNVGDDKYMAIRWKDKIHRLRRVGTSTGAHRFENRKAALVWINIPSKAMLLDSKKGLQLANECRDPEQAKAFAAKSKT